MLLARGIVACSFRYRTSCLGARGCGNQVLEQQRRSISISAYRYARGSAAASWDEAAEIYFRKGEDGGDEAPGGSETAVKYERDDVPKRKSRAMHSEDLDRVKGRSRGGSGLAKGSSGLSKGFTKSYVEERGSRDQEQEEEEEDRPLRQKKDLPVGMHRVNRTQVRRGFPVPDRYRNSRDRYLEEDRPSEVPRLRGEALYGIAPIKAALQARRRDLHVLYVQEKLDEDIPGKRKAGADVKWIMKTARSLELTVIPASKHVLNMLTDNRPHQGLVLDASPLELVEMKALEPPLLLGGKAPVWIALDEVQDPQNFGAILRSGYFFGATGAVVCAKNSAPLSGVVSKASAGALEVMELLYCRNMMKFLQNSVANGWRAVGTSPDPECMSVSEIPKNVPTILVLGNEGVGVRTNVMASCSHLVRISGVFSTLPRSRKKRSESKVLSDEEGKEGEGEGESSSSMKAELIKALEEGPEVDCALGAAAVDSLNVSVAAGILLHEFINHSAAAAR